MLVNYSLNIVDVNYFTYLQVLKNVKVFLVHVMEA
jgi:hypothetical protein